jgi:hypothetical protein
MTPDLAWAETARAHLATLDRLKASSVPGHDVTRRQCERALVGAVPHLLELIDELTGAQMADEDIEPGSAA